MKKIKYILKIFIRFLVKLPYLCWVFFKDLCIILWKTVEYGLDIIKEFIYWLWVFIKELIYSVSVFIKDFIVSLALFLNFIPNFIWDRNLNFYQNLIYNLYLPNSHGKLSMHTSLVVWAVMLSTLTLLLELRRFYLDSSYELSTGFYSILGGLITGVVISFTNFEIQKLKTKSLNNQDKENNQPQYKKENSIKEKIVDYGDPEEEPVSTSEFSEHKNYKRKIKK